MVERARGRRPESSTGQAADMFRALLRAGSTPEKVARIIQDGLSNTELVGFARQTKITNAALNMLGKIGEKLSEKNPERK